MLRDQKEFIGANRTLISPYNIYLNFDLQGVQDGDLFESYNNGNHQVIYLAEEKAFKIFSDDISSFIPRLSFIFFC